MKRKTEFDPMFQTIRGRRSSIRVIGLSLILAALSGLALQAGPIPRLPVPPLPPIAPMPGGYTMLQGPGTDSQPERVQPRDRFVIAAPAEIDPKMVIRARADIDPRMVFNPETGRRGPWSGGLAPRLAPTPVPGDFQPGPSSPQPRIMPQRRR